MKAETIGVHFRAFGRHYGRSAAKSRKNAFARLRLQTREGTKEDCNCGGERKRGKGNPGLARLCKGFCFFSGFFLTLCLEDVRAEAEVLHNLDFEEDLPAKVGWMCADVGTKVDPKLKVICDDSSGGLMCCCFKLRFCGVAFSHCVQCPDEFLSDVEFVDEAISNASNEVCETQLKVLRAHFIIVACLKGLGLRMDCVLGFSVGEMSAFWLSGCVGREDAVRAEIAFANVHFRLLRKGWLDLS